MQGVFARRILQSCSCRIHSSKIRRFGPTSFCLSNRSFSASYPQLFPRKSRNVKKLSNRNQFSDEDFADEDFADEGFGYEEDGYTYDECMELNRRMGLPPFENENIIPPDNDGWYMDHGVRKHIDTTYEKFDHERSKRVDKKSPLRDDKQSKSRMLNNKGFEKDLVEDVDHELAGHFEEDFDKNFAKIMEEDFDDEIMEEDENDILVEEKQEATVMEDLSEGEGPPGTHIWKDEAFEDEELGEEPFTYFTPTPFSEDDLGLRRALDNQIISYLKMSEANSNVILSRRRMISTIGRLIKKRFDKNVKIVSFGSCANTLSTNKSDLDLTIADPSDRLDKKSNKNKKNSVHNMRVIAEVLRNANFRDVTAIPNATVPIVKFKDPKYGIRGDLSAGHLLGVYNSRLLKTYCLLDPRVRPVLFTIKRWAKSRGMNDPVGECGVVTLNSYTICILGLFYMQQIGLLPNLQNPKLLRGMKVKPLSAIHYYKDGRKKLLDATFFKGDTEWWKANKVIDTSKLSVSEVLSGFFEYYSQYAPEKYVISLRSGRLIPRMNPKTDKGKLVVQDPFIVDRNTAMAMSRDTTRKIFPTEFDRAKEILLNKEVSGGIDELCEEHSFGKKKKVPFRKPKGKGKPKNKKMIDTDKDFDMDKDFDFNMREKNFDHFDDEADFDPNKGPSSKKKKKKQKKKKNKLGKNAKKKLKRKMAAEAGKTGA